jgi:hypothetical protein
MKARRNLRTNIICLWKTICSVILAAFVLALMSLPMMAQSQNISGNIVDATGGTIPGAVVTILDVAKGETHEATTDNLGRFQAIGIQPGKYLLSIEKTGFRKAERTVTLDVNAKLDVGQIELVVGTTSDAVTISAEATAAVTTNSMDKAYVVEATQMSELPMNGRNFTSLMSTVPGMSSANQSDFNVNFNDVSQFHSLGGRGSQNNFYLDGSPNIDVGDNQSQYTQASVDAIAEFRVLQSGFNAEYGRNSGMVIAVQTKSGASKFHGTAYEYLRNNAFDAKCVQACGTLQPQLRYNQFGGNISGWVPIPKLSTNQDKRMFFFYNREMTRRNLPLTTYADLPNAQVLGGDFSSLLLATNMQYAPQFKNGTVFQPGSMTRDGAGNIINGTPYAGNIVPQSQWQPLSSNLLKIYTGIPGFSGLPAAPNPGYVRYFYNNPDNLVKNQDLLRFDYAVNSKMNSFFRWVNDYQKESFANGIWGNQPFPIQPQERPKPGSSWSWNLVNTFTPTLVAETILAYNHQSQSLSISGTNPLSRDKLGTAWAQLYPNSNITNSTPDVTTNSGFGFGLGNPGWHNWGKDYSITENMTWIKAAHTLKFGVFLNRDDKAQTGTWPQQGSINFSSSAQMPNDTGNGIANLMLGNFNNFSQPSGAVFPYFRFLEMDAYVQDSWKVSKRLTLDLGMRMPYMVPTYTVVRNGTPGGEGNWRLYSVDLKQYTASAKPAINLSNGFLVGNPMAALSPLGLVCDPCAGTPRGFSASKIFFEPRVGLAYDVFGDGKMALRGGFGMFHERLRQNNFAFGAGGQWPNLSSGTVYNGNVANVDPSVVAGANAPIQPPNMTVWPSDNKMPSIYSWYLGIQRQLPAKFTLDVSYNGNHSVHLMDQRQINALPAGTFVTSPNLLGSVNNWSNALLPYLGWGNLNAVETLAYSRYNAMMFRLSRRFADNFSVNFNYTYSRTMSIVDNDSDVINNPFNIAQNWAKSSYDQPHITTVDFVYLLPKLKNVNPAVKVVTNGWELTGVFRTQSGQPVNILTNGDVKGVNAGSQYPNLIGDPYAGQNSYQWLNQAAFQRPADGQYGTLGRNGLRLPGFWNVDTGIMKNFNIAEKAKVTLRCEVFNLFNHPQVFGINNTFNADNPGSGLSKTASNFGSANAYRDARILQLALRFAF